MPAKKNTSRKKRGRKKTGATRNTESKPSLVSWLILFIVIGLFVTFLIYLDKMPSADNEQESAMTTEPLSVEADSSSAAEKRNPPEHRFDFYTVLPDREIEVNVYEEDEIVSKQPAIKVLEQSPASAAKTPVTMQPAVTKPVTSGRALYQLQVGAFKDLAKADAMKARLAFMGVESNIYVVRSAAGQKIYRVRVGPNSDEKKLTRIQQQLKARNINTMLQKLKG